MSHANDIAERSFATSFGRVGGCSGVEKLPSNEMNECPEVGGGEWGLNVHLWVIPAAVIGAKETGRVTVRAPKLIRLEREWT